MKQLCTLFILLTLAFHIPSAVAVDDDRVPVLRAANVTVAESAGEAAIELQLDQPCDRFVRVSYATRFGNARPTLDFTHRAGRVTFPPGSTSQTIRIPINDDDVDEATQFFWVFLRNPSGLEIEASGVRVNIEDDDPPPSIRFRYDLTTSIEGTSDQAQIVNVAVQLSHRSEKNIRFHVYTADHTASELEFVARSERVLFDAPGTLFNYPIEIVADSDLEGRQQFYVYLRNPANAILDTSDNSSPQPDRIRTKVQILDDDELTQPTVTQASHSFVWMGTFGRDFTNAETAAIAANNEMVVIAKFHANFNIEAHHRTAAELKALRPQLKVLPYFNPKFWFHESDWGTVPNLEWLVHDREGVLEFVDTDRSGANYLDLRNHACRKWILDTVASWIEEGVYDGIAFDSATPIGDFGEGTYWQELLGGQAQVDDWNAGLASLLSEAEARFEDHIVLFNGIGQSSRRGPDRDMGQLAYTGGALNELFAIDLDGQPNDSLISDIELMRTTTDKILLMKSNLRDRGDVADNLRAGRFAYAAFLMGWTPGSSYFRFAIDDFYTTSELEDGPAASALDLGQPTSDYTTDGALLIREFEDGLVLLNRSQEYHDWSDGPVSITVGPFDAEFVQFAN